MKKLIPCLCILTLFTVMVFIFPVSASDTIPVAAFSATPTSGTVPLTVAFIDASSNSPTSWSWTFGDGSTASEENPSHMYSDAGTYTVSLTATNTAGSHTVTKTDFITVNKVSAPVASFTSNVTTGTEPLTVKFTDSSTNSPTKWVWTFGDNDYSTEKNPTHTYTAGGTYTVTLTVTNSGGSDIVTKTGYVTVSAVSAPVVSFTSNITSGTVPLTVVFNDTSTNSPTSWSWTFGDGYTSSSENPTHTYTTAGTYTVSLTATNYGGSNSATGTGFITVNAMTEPVASFTANVTSGTAPLAVNFTDTSTNSPTDWTWTFGDGYYSYIENPAHEYTEAGTYTVTLAVTNEAGSDTVTETDYITVGSEPVAAFTANVTTGTAPLAVKFTDTSTNTPTSWTWTFGDGYYSYIENPTHTYTSAGQYSVTLTVTNAAGSDKVTRSSYIIVTAAETPMTTTYYTTATTVATTRTTAPVTTVPTTAITTLAANASATEETSFLPLVLLGGIVLVVISVIVLLFVGRSRRRARKWEL